jgi:hypothetical protein
LEVFGAQNLWPPELADAISHYLDPDARSFGTCRLVMTEMRAAWRTVLACARREQYDGATVGLGGWAAAMIRLEVYRVEPPVGNIAFKERM